MADNITITFVSNDEELQGIEKLNHLNNKNNLSPAEIEKEGFVSWYYSFDLLKKIHFYSPSIIAKKEDKVIGYALTCTKESAAVHPELAILLKELEQINYKNKKLTEHNFYLMGQICVDKNYRGLGIVQALYNYHKKNYAHKYDFIFTTISTKNQRSIKAHLKQGFTIIQTIQDHFGEWVAVIWDWK